jgi:hypothetical protein
MVAVAGRPLGQDHAGDAVSVGVEEDQDAGRTPGPAGWCRPWRAQALDPADDDWDDVVGGRRQDLGECRETLEDEVETHRPGDRDRRRSS